MNKIIVEQIMNNIENRRTEELDRFPLIIQEELKTGYNMGFTFCKNMLYIELMKHADDNGGVFYATTVPSKPVVATSTIPDAEKAANREKKAANLKRFGQDVMGFITGNK